MVDSNGFLQFDWALPNGVHAFCTTRQFGNSQPPYDSFNVAMHVGDDPKTVTKNRAKLPFSQSIKWLNQVHGTRCVAANTVEVLPNADACYTQQERQVCAVMTADCLPILVCDRQATSVVAIHAGWRGLANGIIEETLGALFSDMQDLLVWVGPSIGQASFEVGDDVVAAFCDYPFAIEKSLIKDKYLFDMKAVCESKLKALAIQNITISPHCSYTEQNLFYSHRKATQQGLKSTGRMLSGIYISQ